jgi:hypothetical protein
LTVNVPLVTERGRDTPLATVALSGTRMKLKCPVAASADRNVRVTLPVPIVDPANQRLKSGLLPSSRETVGLSGLPAAYVPGPGDRTETEIWRL